MSGEPAHRETSGDAFVHVGQLSDDALAGICMLARSLGLDLVRIDLSGCASKAELLERVSAALDFPSWFGGNWDALFDCLADLGWRAAPGYVLLLEHGDELRAAAPEVFDTAMAILGDTARAWQERSVAFRAFVSVGPGAATGGGALSR